MPLQTTIRHLLNASTSAALMCAAVAGAPAFAADAASTAAPAPVVVPDAKLQPSKPAPPSLPTDLPRVRVIENEHGFNVVTASGLPLRGGQAFSFRWGRTSGILAHTSDPAYFKSLKDNGLNAIRLICFDAWQWGHGDPPEYPNGYDHADWDSQKDVDDTYDQIDSVINLASQAGLYVMINYHNTGDYRDRGAKTLNYIGKFWGMTAPRYANRTHVFYEMLNEPLQWWPDNYADENLRDFHAIYKHMRAKAPDTLIATMSFANCNSNTNPPTTMRGVARRFDALGGIDWSKTAVAFHPYSNGGTSAPILDLTAEFPGINSEQGLPDNVLQASQMMDGEYMGVQTMERIGMSWFQWYIEPMDGSFTKNFINRVLVDAKNHKYNWTNDSAIPSAPASPVAVGREGAVILGWKPSPKAAGYNVYRGSKADGSDAVQVASYVHTLSYLDKGLQDGKSYVYQVAAINSLGESPKSATASALPEKRVGGTGTGLTGVYFRSQDLSGAPTVTRLDAKLDFDFGYQPPVQGLEWKNYSLRWQGEVQVPHTGAYTFTVTAKDAIRVWVGDKAGKPLIDSWKTQPLATYTGTVEMKAGEKKPITIEVFNKDGSQVVKLEWSYPGQRLQLVPTEFLYPAP